jgi:hypothetical protein
VDHAHDSGEHADVSAGSRSVLMVRGDHIDAFGGRVRDHVECAYDVGVRNQEYDQHDHAYDDAALDCGAAALEFGDAFHDCVDSAHGLDTLLMMVAMPLNIMVPALMRW